MAVMTPTKPGQVRLRKEPAGPDWRATRTWRPTPWNGQSRVRSMRMPGPAGSGATPVVQPHSKQKFMNHAPVPMRADRRATSSR